MPETTHQQLLLGTHRGDHLAAVSLYRAFAPRMLAYARALLRHDASAEDAVQHAFVRILTTSPDELARVQDVLAWLVCLTRHAALNSERSSARASLREKMKAGHERLNGQHHTEGSQEELLAAINELADDHRELLLLKHVAGLSFDQMALSLNENRNTLASRYKSALNQLRSALPATQARISTPARPRRTEVHHE